MKLSKPTRTQTAAAVVGTAGVGAAAYLANRHFKSDNDKLDRVDVVAGEHDEEAYPSSVSYSNKNTGRITFAKSTSKSQNNDYVFYDIFFNKNSPNPLQKDMWQLLVPLNKTANVEFQKSNNGMVWTQSPYKGFKSVPVLNGEVAWHEAVAFYNNSEYPLRSLPGITTTVPFLDLC